MFKSLDPYKTVLNKVLSLASVQSKRFVLVGLFSSFFAFFTEVLFSKYLPVIIERISDIDLKFSLDTIVAIFILIGITRALNAGLQIFCRLIIPEQFKLDIRNSLIEKFDQLSVTNSDFVSILNQKSEQAGAAANNLSYFVVNFIVFVSIFIYLLITNFTITMIGLGAILPVVLFFKMSEGKITSLSQILKTSWDEINHKSLRLVYNRFFISISGTTSKEQQNIIRNLRVYLLYLKKIFRLMAIRFFLPQIVGLIFIIILLAYKSEINSNPITYAYLFLRLSEYGSFCAQSLASLKRAVPFIDDITNVLNTSDNKNLFKQLVDLDKGDNDFLVSWKVEDMSFEYLHGQKPIFNQFNATIPSCELTVVVGESGVGKTTLSLLLAGYLVPTKGSVKVFINENEYDAKNASKWLQSNISYSGASPFIFEGSLYSNLIYGVDRKVNVDEISSVLKSVNLATLLEHDLGLDQIISSESEMLSTGQLQRVSIARALLSNKAIFIFDEPSANLDDANEEIVANIISNLSKTKTVLCISHRPKWQEIASKVYKL